jgi:hypothetical protein
VSFFTTSNLPKKLLKKIWNLADHIPPLGQLNKLEFTMACKLIALKQNGVDASPNHLYVSASIVSQSTPPGFAVPICHACF